MHFRTTLGAARELGMSQPGVSNAIKHMETQIGFPLFDRVRNRLEPTNEARILTEEAEPLFMMHRVIRQTVGNLKAGRTGHIRLLATLELADTLLPLVIARFVREHPGVDVSIEVLSLDQVLEGVELGAGDVGFVMEPSPRPTVVCEPLTELEMVCICPPGSAIASLSVTAPADLHGLPLIVAPPAGSRINSLIAAAFAEAGQPFRPVIEARFMNVPARLVACGLGVAIVDRLTAVFTGRTDVRILDFVPRISVDVYSVLAKGKPVSRLAGAFIENARVEAARGIFNR